MFTLNQKQKHILGHEVACYQQYIMFVKPITEYGCCWQFGIIDTTQFGWYDVILTRIRDLHEAVTYAKTMLKIIVDDLVARERGEDAPRIRLKDQPTAMIEMYLSEIQKELDEQAVYDYPPYVEFSDGYLMCECAEDESLWFGNVKLTLMRKECEWILNYRKRQKQEEEWKAFLESLSPEERKEWE